MRLPWPRTLFARLMLIWLGGMILVLTVSGAVLLSERDRYARNVLFEGLTRELVAIVDVLDGLPPSQRASWIDTLGRRRLRLALAEAPPEATPLPGTPPLLDALRRALPDHAVTLHTRPRTSGQHPHHVDTLAQLRLGDGSPLTVRLPGPLLGGRPPGPPPGSLVTALIALLLGMTLLTWLAVRVATRPLSRLAAAADALGDDPTAAPLALDGPSEVARAAQAFNHMQQRILQHVEERTRILAAISHDLQTPITRLRLRAEMVEDETLRGRIQADLDAMQALAREGLEYARSLDTSAERQAIDLNALLGALAEDACDMGWTVQVSGQAARPCPAYPTGLRRALWNLIENGVKFGGRVEISLADGARGPEIRIRDHGPGLPDAELEQVFEPFYRTEASRNRDTGGTGLGLAIARNLLRAQGGDVRLVNHPEAGLEAVVSLAARPA